MNILLTGGTGLIGNTLVRKLLDNGHKVKILTRETEVEPPFYSWSNNKIDENAFEDIDGIIHLAGAPLMNSWTDKYKKTIIDSRVKTASLLYSYAKKNCSNLKFFISASGSSYYGQITSNHVFKEIDLVGEDFLAKVCEQWEKAAHQFENLGSKVVCVRTPLVLAKNAESYKLMKMPTSLGFGACLGSGKQWMPWVYIDDLCDIYLKAVENENLKGAINATASEQLNHQVFMGKLAKSFHKSLWLPNIPSFLVKLGMGEKSCLILEGSRLSNQKILDTGFEFKFNDLDEVFKIMNKK